MTRVPALTTVCIQYPVTRITKLIHYIFRLKRRPVTNLC